MIIQRRTRAASQAETRRKLLDTAVDIVAKEGIAAVTVGRVAAEAGLTTGAVYSNFSGRADLLLAVTQRLAGPAHALPPVARGDGAWLEGLGAALADHTDQPDAVALATEMMSVALRDRSVRSDAALIAEDSLSEIAALIAAHACAHPSFTDRELAVVVMALFAGLSQYRSLLGEEAVPTDLCARAFGAFAGQRQVRSMRARRG